MLSTRLTTTVLVAVFIARTLGEHNCKCQNVDSNGNPQEQFDDYTQACCKQQYDDDGFDIICDIKYPGPNHQCVSGLGEIDGSSWADCCHSLGVGVFCW